MSRSAIVLYVPTRQLNRYRQAAACPRAARKSATYRSPRSPILAALVPSVGTMTLQIEFGWRAGAMTPGHPALPTDPCVSSRAAYKFEHHNDRTSVKTNSTFVVSTHGWYAIEDDGNLNLLDLSQFSRRASQESVSRRTGRRRLSCNEGRIEHFSTGIRR
jgi:hypothetical protein